MSLFYVPPILLFAVRAMRPLALGHWLFALSASAAVLSGRDGLLVNPCDSTHEAPIRNANHIFNAIRGAMRQWDNSWNHNGMSFFVATVPEGVQLYHGAAQSEPRKGMQWLAFEPEHALGFAGPRWGGRPGKGGPGHRSPPPEDESHEDIMHQNNYPPVKPSPNHPHHHEQERPHHGPDSNPQHFLGAAPPDHPPPDMQPNSSGYLHFYRTSHDLKLVYIDGLSAGKTTKGTLDSQDYILGLNKYNLSNSPFREGERANTLCNLTRTAWSGRIDGFIRTEQGFEIMLCDFEAGLTFERAQEVKIVSQGRQGQHTSGPFRLYRALADRFHGIGGGRVIIDYSTIVSAFDWDFEKDLFVESAAVPGQLLPRLEGQKEKDLIGLRGRVIDMVARAVKGEVKPTIDWQGVAEMFVLRYAAPLKYLSDANLTDNDLKQELRILLQPFVSDESGDTAVMIERCVEQFVPTIWPTAFAGRVVHQVSSGLCGTLVKTWLDLQSRDNAEERGSHDAGAAKEAIDDLISYLDWPVWRECFPSCQYDEVCVLPIWPITGDVADRRHPSCRNVTGFADHVFNPNRGNVSYWWDDKVLYPPQFAVKVA